MEEKDDYDVFIEEAENVIEHYTAGEDVSEIFFFQKIFQITFF